MSGPSSANYEVSSDEDGAERPPPYSLEDDDDEPAKKRKKSHTCGATLENGKPCKKWAAAGDRWKGDGWRCTKHGGGILCHHYDNGVRCEKLATFDGFETGYCQTHQSARMDCVNCGISIKYVTHFRYGGQCVPCHKKDSKRGKELVARWKRNSKLRELHFEDVFKRQGYRCAQSVVACYDVAGGEPTSVCPFGDREPLRDGCELDHKVRVADGGVDHPDNLQVLCAYCHNVKSAKERRGL